MSGAGACIDNALDCTAPPDACVNDVREEKLLQRQAKGDGRSFIERLISRDRNLLIACVVLLICMNTSTGRFVLYPFRIFATWIHEMCHGMASKLTGGRIYKLEIFKSGAGLAYTSNSGNWRSAFVSSAGYPGTAVTGGLMLLFRRTTLGPTIGTIGLGACMLLSVAFYVRNTWGIWFLTCEGIFLLLCGWKLPAAFLDNLYNFLAATCCLNAADSIDDLYGFGEDASTDAHTVADRIGGDYRAWATAWLCLSVASTVFGILFAFDARENSWFSGERKNNTYYASNDNGTTGVFPVKNLAPKRGQTTYSAAPPPHMAQVI